MCCFSVSVGDCVLFYGRNPPRSVTKFPIGAFWVWKIIMPAQIELGIDRPVKEFFFLFLVRYGIFERT